MTDLLRADFELPSTEQIEQEASVVPQRHAPAPPPAALRASGLTKVFGSGPDAVHALDELSLTVSPGEFVCLVGASGCGKSTLLSILAGLDAPTLGEIEVVGGRPALVFQEPALFPWLSTGKNVEVALRLRGVPRRKRAERARELLARVHLGDAVHKRPHQLSGGMRQRASLARTLALEAPVLLMDEPFGALDAMTRDVLHDELERLWRDSGLTIVFVTHDVREAVRLADRIVLLSSRPGRVVWQASVDAQRPRRLESPEVGRLAGEVLQRLRAEVRRHGR